MRPLDPARLALALLLGLLGTPAPGLAQACPPGQRISPDTAGHCCWPGQAWSHSRNACVGDPDCPAGFTRSGEACLAAAPTHLRAAQEHADKAQALLDLGRWPEAATELRAALAVEPGWAELWLRLGKTCEAQDLPGDAAEAYEKGLAAAPDPAALRTHIAELELQAAQRRQADRQRQAEEARRAEEAARQQELAQRQAEARRREQAARDEAERQRMEAQKLFIHTTKDAPDHSVAVVGSDGRTYPCEAGPTRQQVCLLHVPPGHATLVWGDQGKFDLEVPPGSADVHFKAGHPTLGLVATIVVINAGIVAGFGVLLDQALYTRDPQSCPTCPPAPGAGLIVGSVAVMLAGVGLGILTGYELVPDDVQVKAAPTASLGVPSLRLAHLDLGYSPSARAGSAGATFVF